MGKANQVVTQQRPKIVCICGSTRFVDVMSVEAWKLEKQGIMALSPRLLPQWYGGVQEHHQAEAEGVTHILDELHLRKIDMADEVFVVNVDGYIGDRTRVEIAYAEERGKPVSYLEPIYPDGLLQCTKCGWRHEVNDECVKCVHG